MIEEIAGGVESTPRQPKPRYRATALGARAHRQWLAEELRGDPERHELRRRLLAISAADTKTMLDVVDRYEQACLDEMAELRTMATTTTAIRDCLLAEERRLVLEARLKWILFARRRLQAAVASGEDLGTADDSEDGIAS